MTRLSVPHRRNPRWEEDGPAARRERRGRRVRELVAFVAALVAVGAAGAMWLVSLGVTSVVRL